MEVAAMAVVVASAAVAMAAGKSAAKSGWLGSLSSSVSAFFGWPARSMLGAGAAID